MDNPVEYVYPTNLSINRALEFPGDAIPQLPQLPTNVPLEDRPRRPYPAENNSSTQRPEHDEPFLYACHVLWDAFRRTPDALDTDREKIAAEARLDSFIVLLWFESEEQWRTRSTPNFPPTPASTRFHTPPTSTPSNGSRQFPDGFLHKIAVLRDAFSREKYPSQQEMGDTAVQAGLHPYQVDHWFLLARKACEGTTTRGPITPEVTRSRALSTSLTLEAELNQNPIPTSRAGSIQSTIESLAQGNHRKRKSRPRETVLPKRKRQAEDTNNPQDSLNIGASGEGRYPCLSCDKVSFNSKDWLSHQKKKHFLKKTWVCGIEHTNLSSTHPFTRSCNFDVHLQNFHEFPSPEARRRAISEMTINLTSLYHEVCGFCSQGLDGRDASLNHILAHIENGYRISDWNHQCSSKDHDIEEQVRLELARRDFEPGNDNLHDDDNDYGDSDGSNLDGGNYPGDGGNSFGSHGGQYNGEGSSYGDGGGDICFGGMGYMRMARGAAEGRPEELRLASSRDPSERTSSMILSKQSFKVLRTLGRGGSAEVFEVSHSSSEQSFALKVIRRKQFGLSSSPEQRAFNNEVQIMRTLRHPHIVEILGSRIQADHFSLLMSPVADMDLAEYLTTTKEASLASPAPIDRSSLFGLCSSIGEALNFVHSRGWVHGDIKPSNILIFGKEAGSFAAKLSDFGCATLSPNHEEQIKVTPEYASPETILYGRKSSPSDIFSLGCVFLEMATLMYQSLFEFERLCFTDGDKSFHKNLGRIDQWIKMMDKEQELKACPDKAHSIPFDIISKMLRENPENRPTAREVWLSFPNCTCCSKCRATRYQHPSGQDDDGDDVHSNQDWGPRGKASQIVGDSAELCVPVCATPLKDWDVPFSSTNDMLPLTCSSPRSDLLSTNLDKPKGSTTIGCLKSFSPLYEPPHEHLLDILFVHGLGPTNPPIWTEPKKFFDWPHPKNIDWLQDMGSKMPQAKISTYGYDSKIWSDSSDGGTTTAARDLLERLSYIRKDCQERPLVFVADSSGDTIVKKALSLAKYDRKYSGIYHATRGVVFLDTGQDSQSKCLDEVMLSRLSMSAAPMVVKVFKNGFTPTTLDEPLDEPASAETESTAEDHECSTSTQAPSTVASACTDKEESNSSDASPPSSQMERSTMHTMGPQQIALCTSIIETIYRGVMMSIEKERRGLGASGIVTSTSALACN